MRELEDHKINPFNREYVLVAALDEPGAGGACHRYRVSVVTRDRAIVFSEIEFQNGPINEAGVNGITDEALLAVVIDRMKGFETGPYTCSENRLVIKHLEAALQGLKERSREREARGVEGTRAV